MELSLEEGAGESQSCRHVLWHCICKVWCRKL